MKLLLNTFDSFIQTICRSSFTCNRLTQFIVLPYDRPISPETWRSCWFL